MTRGLFISLNAATVSRPSSVGIVAQGWPLELGFLSHNCDLVVKRRLWHFQVSIQVQDMKKEKGQMKVQKGNVFMESYCFPIYKREPFTSLARTMLCGHLLATKEAGK